MSISLSTHLKIQRLTIERSRKLLQQIFTIHHTIDNIDQLKDKPVIKAAIKSIIRLIIQTQIPIYIFIVIVSFAIYGLEIINEKTTKDKPNAQKISFTSLKNIFERIAPKTWKKTQYAFGDIVEAHHDEIKFQKKKNPKFIAYLITYSITFWELLKFSLYFSRNLASNTIKNRKTTRQT